LFELTATGTICPPLYITFPKPTAQKRNISSLDFLLSTRCKMAGKSFAGNKCDWVFALEEFEGAIEAADIEREVCDLESVPKLLLLLLLLFNFPVTEKTSELFDVDLKKVLPESIKDSGCLFCSKLLM
jgi:hypothetical protein